MKTRMQVRHEIIAAMLARHGVTEEEFFGPGRMDDATHARREAAQRLHAAGFRISTIARIIKRSHGTIQYYLRHEYLSKRRDRARATLALKRISSGISDLVAEIAQDEGISPVLLAMQWIAERAEYEMQAKARAA